MLLPEYGHPRHIPIRPKRSKLRGELLHVQKKQGQEHFRLVLLLAQRHQQSEDTL